MLSVMGYLPLIQKDSVTHVYGRAVYVNKGVRFTIVSFFENPSVFILMFSIGFTSPRVLIRFYITITSHFFCIIFDAISSNARIYLSIPPSTNVFAFGGYNDHNKDQLLYFDRTDRSREIFCTCFST